MIALIIAADVLIAAACVAGLVFLAWLLHGDTAELWHPLRSAARPAPRPELRRRAPRGAAPDHQVTPAGLRKSTGAIARMPGHDDPARPPAVSGLTRSRVHPPVR